MRWHHATLMYSFPNLLTDSLYLLPTFLQYYCCLVVSTSVTTWTVAHRIPLSMGFSQQEYWNGLLFLTPGDLPNPGIGPASPALQVSSLPLSHRGSPFSSTLSLIPPSFSYLPASTKSCRICIFSISWICFSLPLKLPLQLKHLSSSSWSPVEAS